MAENKTPVDRPSSMATEQIEDLARAKLAAYPDLALTEFDFGTAPDGSLQIWVNGSQYNAVKDIPDVRIREAIEQAVAEFNK
jgi:hypothetical protein